MLKKHYQITIFVLFCFCLNYAGKEIAGRLTLPMWLDSVGTVFAAYVLGPISGAVVGFTTNLTYGMKNYSSMIYGITNITIGLIAGFMARRKHFETFFGTTLTSMIITVASVLISTPLNLFFSNGKTGNMWGDGVIEYLIEHNIPFVPSCVIGEFYIDFVDKVVSLLLLFAAIKLFRRGRSGESKALTVIPWIIGFSLFFALDVRASVSGDIIEKPLFTTKNDAEHINYNSYVQTIFSSDNGLPPGEANAIAQTNDGVLWVGTYAGLYRYNGTAFKWMSDFDTVRSVNCLYVDPEGRMWIGTNDDGLSILVNGKLSNTLKETDGLPSDSVRCVVLGADGCYYIGTSSYMQILELNSGMKLLETIPEICYAHSIDADSRGYVATVTNEGELYVLKDHEIIMTEKMDSEQEKFTCVSFGPDGMLYVGTSQGRIIVADISNGDFHRYKIKLCGNLTNLNRIAFTEAGTLFICANNGIGYFDGFNYNDLNAADFRNNVSDMAVDYQGNLWFASTRLGLLSLAKSAFVDLFKAVGTEPKVVNAVAYWKNKYFIGTDEGLMVMDRSQKNIRPSEKLVSDLYGMRIRCLEVDSGGNLWISTYGKGLIKADRNERLTIYDSIHGNMGDWVRLTLELSDGTIAASSEQGITFIKDGKIKSVIPPGEKLGSSMVLCMLQLPDDTILAGTDGDGIAVIRNGIVEDRIEKGNGLTSGVILKLIRSESYGGIYIVTSNGLCYMDPDMSIRHLEHFPYFNNYDVWSDGHGKIFVPGSAGVHVVKESALLSGDELSDYDLLATQSGLSGALTANSFSIKDENNNLYLCSDCGVYRINMDDYTRQSKSYRININYAAFDGVKKNVEKGEALVVGRNVNVLEIFPEIINYTTADPDVTYCLEGFEETLHEASQKTLGAVTYTNIPGGQYYLRLSVLDSNRNVMEEARYSIIKEEEFHDTPGFKIYMLIVMAAAVAWLTWFFVLLSTRRAMELKDKQLALAEAQLQLGNETILAIAKTVDAKDENTSQHSQRVSEYSVLLARQLGFSDEECENLRRAALLHDIGKIGIPDRILNKPARLTDEEYTIMKSHVTKGADILKDFTLIDHVVEGALYHHERYDGKGYQSGIAGEAIPIYGRIISVADAFDAMTANRVYRKKLDTAYVLGELEKGRGTQFDPKIVDALMALIENGSIKLG